MDIFFAFYSFLENGTIKDTVNAGKERECHAGNGLESNPGPSSKALAHMVCGLLSEPPAAPESLYGFCSTCSLYIIQISRGNILADYIDPNVLFCSVVQGTSVINFRSHRQAGIKCICHLWVNTPTMGIL